MIDATRLHEPLGLSTADGLASEAAAHLDRLTQAVAAAEAEGRLKPCFRRR